MSIICLVAGHDFKVTDKTKEENGITYCRVSCSSCNKEKWIEQSIICEDFDCLPYIVGINSMKDRSIERNYSQRCYRCPRCGEAWFDETRDLLEGSWYAVDGQAIHSSEMGERDFSILDQINRCKTIKDARKLIENIKTGKDIK